MSAAGDRAAAFVLAALSHDATSDGLLDGLTRGLLDPFDRTSEVAHDGEYPWQLLTDSAVAPLWALPYAGQWTGGKMPARFAGESDADYEARARAELTRPRGMRRGSPQSLKSLAQSYLTGSKTVVFAQRIGGVLYDHAVYVYAAECPSTTALEDALNAPDVIAAGHKVTVQTLAPGSWTVGLLEDVFYGDTVAELEAAYSSVSNLESNTP